MSTKSAVTKGRITIPARGNLTQQFLFNPTEIHDIHQVNWGTLAVPGASHPVKQFGSGGERIISFDLYLDGDRGNYKRSPANNTADGYSGNSDISSIVTFYQSLSYPAAYGGGYTNVYPWLILLKIGNLFPQAVPCILNNGSDVKYTYFKNDMTPVRAVIPMVFSEVITQSRTAPDVLNQFSVNGPGY